MSGGWKFAAASVIGTSHLSSPGGICQDAHGCAYDSDADRLVCVVSDGAGSASRSERGSRLACDVVLDLVSKGIPDAVHTKRFALETLDAIRTAIQVEAAHENRRAREYACTLLVAIVEHDRATFWQIGDGAICFRLPSEDSFRFMFWPSKGEYANVTYFVTDENAPDELEFDSICNSLADVALFSDGLERLALDFAGGEAHTKFFAGFFPYLYREPAGHLIEIERKLTEFLASERINSKTDDDKTLILATVESK
jgi:hypothetical protein